MIYLVYADKQTGEPDILVGYSEEFFQILHGIHPSREFVFQTGHWGAALDLVEDIKNSPLHWAIVCDPGQGIAEVVAIYQPTIKSWGLSMFAEEIGHPRKLSHLEFLGTRLIEAFPSREEADHAFLVLVC